MPRWLLLEAKHRLFAKHHERLAAKQDPVAAEAAFRRRLRQMREAHAIRLGCYVGLYFTAVAAIVGVALARSPALSDVRSLLEFVAGISSSLTILFLGGVFLANRFEGLAEIELHFYSDEARTKT
ncbi:MAG TPA: hypothetical protein VI818_07465 [Candidatus Thermoplasmatota archaeon]|nr:hypothetical protein [Candidatus Thermoplasmatota archaeon]